VHHLPAPPPSRLTRSGRRLTGLRTRRRGRPLWAPLLLACALATVALTAAVGGGTLPGLSDASSSSAAQQRADETGRSAETSHTPRRTSGSSSPAATVVVPPTSTAPTPSPAPTESTPASEPDAPEPAPGTPAESPAPATTPAPAKTPAPVLPSPPAAIPPPAAAAPAAPGPEGQVLSLVNAERAKAGCAPLSADSGLAALARAHSADMRDRDFFSHDNPDGLGPFDRAAAAGVEARAENIAYGYADAAEVMAGWMSSRGHRENILDCDLRALGVGVATGPGGPWWTQLFD
jgi:uncharacterized protein YkwD